MNGINNGRVILGGLLAGTVINLGEFLRDGVWLAATIADALEKLGVPEPTPGQVGLFVLLGFALGILMVWLYAAIRPRFGPGVRTAIMAGVVVWLLIYPFASIGYYMLGMFPGGYLLIANVWGLVEIPLAGVVGAWIYQEELAVATA